METIKTNIELQRVTLKQAKKLREKGFDQECNGRYNKYDTDNAICKVVFIRTDYNDCSEFISAPTVAEALKWFRDEKGFITGIRFSTKYKAYCVRLGLEKWEGKYKTWDEAENAILDAILKWKKII